MQLFTKVYGSEKKQQARRGMKWYFAGTFFDNWKSKMGNEQSQKIQSPVVKVYYLRGFFGHELWKREHVIKLLTIFVSSLVCLHWRYQWVSDNVLAVANLALVLALAGWSVDQAGSSLAFNRVNSSSFVVKRVMKFINQWSKTFCVELWDQAWSCKSFCVVLEVFFLNVVDFKLSIKCKSGVPFAVPKFSMCNESWHVSCNDLNLHALILDNFSVSVALCMYGFVTFKSCVIARFER